MPGPKTNNRRVYPDAGRQPRQLSSFRRKEAVERQEAYDKLSIEDKIQRLDMKLGVGLGATKQRERLQAALEKRKQPKPEPALVKGEIQVIVADTSPKQQKKYMKGKRQ